MSASSGIPVLELKGEPYDRGRQHGEALRSGIQEMLSWEAEANVPLLGSRKSRMQEYTNKFIPYIEQYAADLLDEMKGIAEGAGVTLGDIVQLNSSLELTDDSLPVNFAKHYPACTSFAVRSNIAADGRTYLCQTYDMPAYYQRHLVLLKIPTAEGGEALVQSFAGVVGCSGVNSHGLALVINNLFPDDTQPGVPHWVVARKVLDQPRLADAIGTIVGMTRASGFNYTLGTSKDIVGVETSATQADFLYARDGYLFHANHYLTERLKPRDMLHMHAFGDPTWAATYGRCLRMGRLLGDAAGKDKIAYEQLWEMMCNHEDFPFSICFHGYEAKTEIDQTGGASVCSLVLKPETGEMHITNGNPCRFSPERHCIGVKLENPLPSAVAMS